LTFAWTTQIPREGSNPPRALANPERRSFTLQSVSSQKLAYKISTAAKRPSTTASNPNNNYTSAHPTQAIQYSTHFPKAIRKIATHYPNSIQQVVPKCPITPPTTQQLPKLESQVYFVF